MDHELFPGQKPDEEVKILVRPHWLALFKVIVVTLFLALVPIVAIVAVGSTEAVDVTGLDRAIVGALVGGYYLALTTYFFIAWLDMYLDVGIVTDDRVVDIDQHGLFRRNIAELDLKVVQDVAADRSGILQTVFNFGNVNIQTAGERPNFTFELVPKPERVVDNIREVANAVSSSEEEAAEKMGEAAEKMEQAAETITDGPSNPGGNQPPARQPQVEQQQANQPDTLPQQPARPSENDHLPREHGR